MTRVFEPDPTRNPLARALDAIEAEDREREIAELRKILEFMETIAFAGKDNPKRELVLRGLIQLHIQIGNWLEGNYGE